MATRKQKDVAPEAAVLSQLERITKLLGLIAVKGQEKADQIEQLAAIGFSNVEIAGVLGVTANTVNVALYRARKKR